MKKLILPILFALTACIEHEDEKFDRFMTELDCPVILIGKTEPATNVASMVVRDGKGRVRTFNYQYGMPQAISQSRHIGDTLKPCK